MRNEAEVDCMKVKRVTLDDLEVTYCCMGEIPPNVSWTDFLHACKRC